jgi:hypothetical protein
MTMRQSLRPVLLGLALVLALLVPAHRSAAETCTADSFGDAVDQSAAALRAFSAETQPKLKQRLQALRDHKKWTAPDFETKGLALIHDQRLDEFDAQASDLLSRIDSLGSPETSDAANLDCSKLNDLKAASSELMAVMRAKSAYLIARIDREIGASPPAASTEVAAVEAPKEPAPAPVPATPPAIQQPSADAVAKAGQAERIDEALSPLRRPEGSAAAKAEAPAAKPPSSPTPPPAPPAQAKAPPPTPPAADEPAKTETEHTSSWSTTTAQAVIPPPHLRAAPSANDLPPAFDPPPPGQPYELPPADGSGIPPYDPAAGEGYTIEEIQEATRGFFGTISTSLASVIEHAFKQSGRPTGYVLGKEGGGAFLAGLRYGEGTLYLRSGGTAQVYWHGPSIGYDVGAEGSRTLFLIYNLDEPNNLFRRFTGVDGSAYLVGGVGMTLLKGGPVLMAPIRSGLGLRLGASVGYVRFTSRPTWNPF